MPGAVCRSKVRSEAMTALPQPIGVIRPSDVSQSKGCNTNASDREAARTTYRAAPAFKACLNECPFPTLAYAYEISTR